MTLTVNGKNLGGSIAAVQSKSMAHRLLICAALSDNPSLIHCKCLSDDITATAQCLNEFSANVEYNGEAFSVSPKKANKTAEIDCGESGSTLRFLLPIISSLGVSTKITMHARLPERPLQPLYGELCRHGAHLSPEGANPLSVSGKITSGDYTLAADVSSQFISGLLFALPLTEGSSRIILTGVRESVSYISMTLSALALFGICIKQMDFGYEIPGNQRYHSPGELFVEGDWSNAAFWLAAGFPEDKITVTGLLTDSLQGDRRAADIIEKMKADGEIRIDCSDIPDLVPALSVAACKRSGETVFYNAKRLRLKESDRLKTTSAMLQSLGGVVDECDDGLIVRPALLHPGTVDAAGDHRIAMAAAAASQSAGEVTIIGAECAGKSYPRFFEDFVTLGGTFCRRD